VLSWFQLAQLAFAAFVIAVISERVRALHSASATSDDAARWLSRSFEAGAHHRIRNWVHARPSTQLSRIAELALDDPAEMRELLADLRDESLARLGLLRASATLASTLGLLGGILTLARGTSHNAGLLALQAGAVERLTMDEAITTMAIGVGTSALCFQALALLRPAAEKHLAQARQLARAAGCLPYA
jgi:hypothetical protein